MSNSRRSTASTFSYTTDINDNASYFGKIQGPLSRGQSIDRDIVVLTDNDRYLSLMIKKGWAEKLDKSAIPNMKNLVACSFTPAFDPNRDYSLPWQSGMTGIAYNDKLTDPVLSIDELLTNPKLKGKITVLNSMGDALTCVMLANGDDPTKVTDKSFNKAFNGSRRPSTRSRSASSRATTTHRCSRRGDLAAAMSWSGDIAQIGNPHIHWNVPTAGGALWTDNMLIPKGGNVYTASFYMNYVYDPKVAALIEGRQPEEEHHGHLLHLARGGRARELREEGQPGYREEPAHLPDAEDARQREDLRLERVEQSEVPAGLAEPRLGVEGADGLLSSSSAADALPAARPRRAVAQRFLRRSARLPRLPVAGVRQLRHRLLVLVGLGQLLRMRSENYRGQFIRSLEYAGIATLLALLLSYPVAYWIAFRGGRWKNLLLLFIVAPFFVTYLIRTLAWETILSDNGFVVHTLQHLHVLGPGGRLLATSTAVVTGITYNFLPFMALPLYVSLEQIDERLLEAAQDLYASKWKAFLRVTLPLSLPGVVAGTLLTFIPAAGDFINAQLLGSPQNHMIGNVIQSKFLELTDYPAAAAMSFILMAGILVAVVVYARAVGTEQLTGTPG